MNYTSRKRSDRFGLRDVREGKKEEGNEERSKDLVLSLCRCHKIWLMKRKGTGNNIAILIIGVVLMLVGEGVFKWGGWLVVLLMVSEWEGVFWYAVILGMVLAGMNGTGLGWTSLVLLGVSLVFRSMKGIVDESRLMTVLILGGIGWLVDRLLGMSWSWVEILLSGGLFWLVSSWWGKRSDLSVRN